MRLTISKVMSPIHLMLTSKASLPRPKYPGLFTERKLDEADSDA